VIATGAVSLRRLALYYGLACAVSWLIWLPFWAPGLGLPALPLELHYPLGAYGPALAAILVTAMDGPAALRSFVSRLFATRGRLGLIAMALLAPFVLAGVVAAVGLAMPALGLSLDGAFNAPVYAFLLPWQLFVFYLATFAIGEEIGWRGFALPRLDERLSPLPATLVLTLFWGLWHWPLFLFWPGFTGMGLAGAIGWFVSLLLGSFLLTVLQRLGRGSIVAPVLFHAAINTVFANSSPASSFPSAIGAGVTLAGLAAAIWLALQPRQA
jgi:uncharacterized protein